MPQRLSNCMPTGPRLATMTVFTEYGWVEILTQLAASAEQGDDGPGASQGAARFFKPGNKTMH